MALSRRSRQTTGGPHWAWAVLLMLGCQASAGSSQAPTIARPPNKVVPLQSAEIARLTHRIEVLEQQLQQERRSAALDRIENQQQRERLLALEGRLAAQATDSARSTAVTESLPRASRASLATTVEVEAELRHVFQSLLRAIERMDITEQEKSALKNSLKPTRSLDQSNPWASAGY